MSIIVLVNVVETHLVEEEFSIDKLPEDWEDMSMNEQWAYVAQNGVYIQSDTQEIQVDSVQDIEIEEAST